MQSIDLAELLLDLEHDLGKHLALPVALLPARASVADVEEAVRRGLEGTGGRSARQLWQELEAAAKAELGSRPEWAALERAVRAALAWGGVARPDRATVQRDFSALKPAIRALRLSLGKR